MTWMVMFPADLHGQYLYDLPITEMFGINTVGAGYGDYNLNAGIVETPNGFVNYATTTTACLPTKAVQV